jgi:thiamine biosynthesis lipoprotein
MSIAAPPVPRRVRVERIMGTVVSFDVRAGGAGVEAAIEDAVGWLRDVDARFSTYRADSEISRIDRDELAAADASAVVRRVLARCMELRKQTGGYFDARAGGHLDPSALVKGWAVQHGADLLRRGGLTDFCVTAGGDLVVCGGALPERRWRVGIQHPLDRKAVAAAIDVTDLAVATSGAYERGEHLVDPHRGAAPGEVLSVTVVGPDLGTADAYSTAAFAMGADGPAWTLCLDGYEAMTILTDHTVLCTPGFPLGDEAAA